MAVYIRPGVMVRINQFDGPRSPQPLPLQSGFSTGKLYEILGLQCMSESSEAFCIMANDLGQLWFISNRHLQVCQESLPSSFEAEPAGSPDGFGLVARVPTRAPCPSPLTTR